MENRFTDSLTNIQYISFYFFTGTCICISTVFIFIILQDLVSSPRLTKTPALLSCLVAARKGSLCLYLIFNQLHLLFKVTFTSVQLDVDIPALVAAADRPQFPYWRLCVYTQCFNIFFISSLLYWHNKDFSIKDM